MNRREMPPGFGLLARKATSQAAVLISQSPGAFPSGACQEKRQRTAAVQDAVAPCHRSRRVHGPVACAKQKEAFPEPHSRRRESAQLFGQWARPQRRAPTGAHLGSTTKVRRKRAPVAEL